MDVSQVTFLQVKSLTRELTQQDVYKDLSAALGGWYPIANTTWGLVVGMAVVGVAAFEGMLFNALSLLGTLGAGLTERLVDFTADLVNGLIVIGDAVASGAASGLSSVAGSDGTLGTAGQGAMMGASIAATVVVMVVGGPMMAIGEAGKAAADTFLRGAGLALGRERNQNDGSRSRGWGMMGVGIIALAAVALAAVTVGAAGALVAVAVIGAGAAMGAGLAVYYEQMGAGEEEEETVQTAAPGGSEAGSASGSAAGSASGMSSRRPASGGHSARQPASSGRSGSSGRGSGRPRAGLPLQLTAGGGARPKGQGGSRQAVAAKIDDIRKSRASANARFLAKYATGR